MYIYTYTYNNFLTRPFSKLSRFLDSDNNVNAFESRGALVMIVIITVIGNTRAISG